MEFSDSELRTMGNAIISHKKNLELQCLMIDEMDLPPDSKSILQAFTKQELTKCNGLIMKLSSKVLLRLTD